MTGPFIPHALVIAEERVSASDKAPRTDLIGSDRISWLATRALTEVVEVGVDGGRDEGHLVLWGGVLREDDIVPAQCKNNTHTHTHTTNEVNTFLRHLEASFAFFLVS